MKRQQYQHRRHNKNLLMVHLIFVTKYRRKLFYHSFREDVKQYIFQTCMRYHWYLKKIETDKDHIHMLILYYPTDPVTKMVSTLKQYSIYYAWRDHKDLLSRQYWKKRTLWSDGYFAASIGQVSQTTIEHYVKNQG